MTTELLTVETVRPYVPPPLPIMHAEASEHRTAGITTVLGFWVYLMSDCLLFAALFATYSVLGREFAGGPTSKELFDLPRSEEHTSELQSHSDLVCRLLLEKKKTAG